MELILQQIKDICPFDKLSPLSQTFILNCFLLCIPVDIHCYLPEYNELWNAWATDYIAHFDKQHRSKWHDFLIFHDLTQCPLMMNNVSTFLLQNIDSYLEVQLICLKRKISSPLLLPFNEILHTRGWWTREMAVHILQHYLFPPCPTLFPDSAKHPNYNYKDDVKYIQKKLSVFTETKTLTRPEIVDWFFLRYLLFENRDEVCWSGGSVQLLLDSPPEEYTYQNVYDKFEQKNIDIDIFYGNPCVIETWLNILQHGCLCKIKFTDDNWRYAKVQFAYNPHIRFKMNLIRVWNSEHMKRSPRGLELTNRTIQAFDSPAPQRAIMVQINTTTSMLELIEVQSLANVLIHQFPEWKVYYNCANSEKLKQRLTKYKNRKYNIVETTNLCFYGHVNNQYDEVYQNRNQFDFFPITDFVSLDSLPAGFND